MILNGVLEPVFFGVHLFSGGVGKRGVDIFGPRSGFIGLLSDGQNREDWCVWTKVWILWVTFDGHNRENWWQGWYETIMTGGAVQ